MLCQLFSIFETGKSSLFKVLEPLDDACGNIIFFGIGPSGFPLRSFHSSRHDMNTFAIGYKDCER